MSELTSNLIDEIIAEYIRLEEAGEAPDREALQEQHPKLAEELREFFADRDQFQHLASPFTPPVMAQVPPLSKIRYFGDYELLEEIARGGMGIVYKARQESLNRIVAVKMILSGHLATEDDVRRFKTEAEAAAGLQHPGIVPVYEVGTHDGQHFFSMEYVDGKTLADLIRDNPLPAQQAARYVQEIAETLAYAHQHGTLHRDLKPSNVIIDFRDDSVRITDFGLAMRVEADSKLTRTGQILGTPSYMSPEQAESKRGLIGPGSDVYSMGVVLYELLTGRPPFRAETAMETILQVVETEPLSPRMMNPSVPKDLETICLKCLEKEPHKRYATAKLLADDLGRHLNGEPILARPIGRVARGWRWCKRKPAFSAFCATAAALVLILAIGGPLVAWREGMLRDRAEELAVQNRRLADEKSELVDEKQAALSRESRLRKETETTLYHSLVNEANALRLARKPGYRPLAWSRLKQAMAIDTPAKDTSRIRQEAVACLGDFVANEAIIWKGLNEFSSKMAIFPDSRRVALVEETSNEKGKGWLSTISIRTIPANRETATLRIEFPGRISDLAITPDGGQLVVCDYSGSVEVWQQNEAGKWERINRHEPPPLFRSTQRTYLRIFPDGRRYLLCQFLGRGFTIRGLTDPKLDKSIPIPDREFLGIPSFSPDGGFLAAPLETSKTIGIWNVETGKLERRIVTPFKSLEEAAFTPDGHFLFCGANDGFAMYDAKTFQQLSLARLDAVYSMTFTPDSQVLAFSTLSRKIRLWNLNSQREIAVIDHAVKRYADILRITPDGRWMLSAGENELRLWQLRGLPEKLTLAGHREMVPGNAFSHDGELLATCSKDETVRLWNVQTGALLLTISPGYIPQSIAFSQDGRLMAIGSYIDENTEHQLTLWDLKSRRRVAGQTVPGRSAIRIVFTSNGRQLVVCGNGLTVFDIVGNAAGRNADQQIELKQRDYVPGSRSWYLTVSSDDQTVVWVNNKRSLRVWDLKQRQEHDVFPKNLLLLGWHNVSFLPDDRHVIFIAASGKPQVWDTKTGKMAYEIAESPRFQSFHNALSPDGRWLAGDATAEALTIIDVKAKKTLFTLPSERSPIKSVSWSPDGNRIAVGLADGGVSIWDMESVKKQLTEIALGWK